VSWLNACDEAAVRYTVTAGVLYTWQHLHVPEWSPISNAVHCTVCDIVVHYYCVHERRPQLEHLQQTCRSGSRPDCWLVTARCTVFQECAVQLPRMKNVTSSYSTCQCHQPGTPLGIIKLHLASQVPCAKATIQPWYQNSTTRRWESIAAPQGLCRMWLHHNIHGTKTTAQNGCSRTAPWYTKP
jgi:hypothetical protein